MHAAQHRPASVLNGLFVVTLVMLAYLGAIGFGMVWLRHKISVTANTNRNLEQQIAELQRDVNEVAAEIAYALNPEQLIRKNAEFRLDLVRPSEQQVFRVTADVERRLATKRFGHYYTANGDRVAETAGSPRPSAAAARLQ
jgi:cell division protein FtsB